MRSRSSTARLGTAVISAVALAVTGLLLPGAASATSTPSWASAAHATIHPGVGTDTQGGACTANFVYFTDTAVFLGEAAHCALPGDSPVEGLNADGCHAASLPLNTRVAVEGASKPGILVYSSWLTMQARHETDPHACLFNDLALIKLDRADVGKVNPSVPFFGGPTGIHTTGTSSGDGVETYGNSPLRGGVSQLSPKTGISLGDEGGGWDHDILTLTPGIPGDSGSAVLASDGSALGVLSTVALLALPPIPPPGSNGVGDLGRELAYLNSFGGLGSVQLARGTEPFHSGLL